jgi:hypothetical protein
LQVFGSAVWPRPATGVAAGFEGGAAMPSERADRRERVAVDGPGIDRAAGLAAWAVNVHPRRAGHDSGPDRRRPPDIAQLEESTAPRQRRRAAFGQAITRAEFDEARRRRVRRGNGDAEVAHPQSLRSLISSSRLSMTESHR